MRSKCGMGLESLSGVCVNSTLNNLAFTTGKRVHYRYRAMGLAAEVRNAARALEGASYALAHVLRTPPGIISYDGLPDGSGNGVRTNEQPNNAIVEDGPESLEMEHEAEALCITVRAVLDEAAPVLVLLEDESKVVRGGEKLNRVQNGFGSLCAILVTLLDHATTAVLATSGGRHAGGALERMRTHHGQLRALYGILHLAARVVDKGDVTKSLFVDVSKAKTGDESFDPRRCRAAINMDDFYGRWFGFHYAPHMRNVLRIVNIVRGSVSQAVAEPNLSPLGKNVAMLGWGWVYTNMVLMNNLGVNIDGASKIGADNDSHTSVDSVRTFMNLVEDPVIAGFTNLASADTAIDRAFHIPKPKDFRDVESLACAFKPSVFADIMPDNADYATLWRVFQSVKDPVAARLISAKKRPFSLNGLQSTPAPPEEPIVVTPHSPMGVVEDCTDTDIAPILQATPNGAQNPITSREAAAGLTVAVEGGKSLVARADTRSESGSLGLPAKNGTGKTVKRSPIAASLAGVAESSYLASALKTEFTKLQSNVSSLLGLSQALPAKSLILHFHGGGFVGQSSVGHSVYLKEWCASMPDTVILCIDYKLSPENRYPTALHECVYAYQWAIENAAALGCRAERIVLVGDSAGGNIALATALLATDAGLRKPDGVCLAYPSLYLARAWSPSRLLSFFDPMLPLSVMEICMSSYLDQEAQERAPHDPYISPVVASMTQLRNLPKFCAIVGSLDPLLDDTVLLHHRLKEAGRKGDTVQIYDAMPHGFLNMIQVSEQARGASTFIARHMASFADVHYGNNAPAQVAPTTEEATKESSAAADR